MTDVPRNDEVLPEDDEAVSQFLPSYLRVRDVAQLLDVHVDTVRTWMREGKLKFLRVGGTIRLNEDEVRRFLLKNQELVGIDTEKDDATSVSKELPQSHPTGAFLTRLRGVELAFLEGRNGLRSLLDEMRIATSLSPDFDGLQKFMSVLDEALFGIGGAVSGSLL